jgi:hypothetical protein
LPNDTDSIVVAGVGCVAASVPSRCRGVDLVELVEERQSGQVGQRDRHGRRVWGLCEVICAGHCAFTECKCTEHGRGGRAAGSFEAGPQAPTSVASLPPLARGRGRLSHDNSKHTE